MGINAFRISIDRNIIVLELLCFGNMADYAELPLGMPV